MSGITLNVTNSLGQLATYNNVDIYVNLQDIFTVEPVQNGYTSNYNVNYSFGGLPNTYLICNVIEWFFIGTESLEYILALDDSIIIDDTLILNFNYINNVEA